MKTLPCRPQRFWRKIAGPGDVTLIRTNVSAMTGKDNARSASDTAMSKIRFAYSATTSVGTVENVRSGTVSNSCILTFAIRCGKKFGTIIVTIPFSSSISSESSRSSMRFSAIAMNTSSMVQLPNHRLQAREIADHGMAVDHGCRPGGCLRDKPEKPEPPVPVGFEFAARSRAVLPVPTMTTLR